MRVHVGLLLAIERLGLLMHGVERLDGVVDGGDTVAELVERVLLAASAPAARIVSRPLATLVA